MRNGILGSIAVLLAGAGLALAEPLPPTPPDPSPPKSPTAATDPKVPKATPAPNQPADKPSTALPGDCLAPGLASVAAAEEASLDGPKPDCATPQEPEPQCLFWVSGEYLLWTIKDAPLHEPVVTTGPPGTLGALTTPGTSVLQGSSNVDLGTFSGLRGTVGFAGPGGILGMEASGFLLEKRLKNFSAASDTTGSPVLARPVINAQTGLEDSFLIAAPGAFSGSITTAITNRLWGAELNLNGSLYRSSCWSVDLLAGGRYLNLEENFDVGETTTLLSGGIAGFAGMPLVPGQTIAVSDHFGTQNQFYGGQIGAQAEYRYQCFFVYAMGKVGFGSNHETVNIVGSTSLLNTVNQAIAVSPGGLLAVASNSGLFSRNEFAVVPEGAINVGYQITPQVTASVGYTFMYWSDVVRPGDQISRTVNPGLVPSSLAFGQAVGPAQPTFAFRHSDFWAQGLTVGVSFRY
jgi:hypothetical protein